jgi:Rrf2 family protein
MLALGKKIDYALISLSCLGERAGRFVSAREIAEVNGLPLPALMQILKELHHQGVLRSTRGVKGGYQIGVDLESLSLHTLSEMLDSADSDPEDPQAAPRTVRERHLPVETMREKLEQFLRNVRVSEVVSAGRRIDVPLHSLRILDRLRERELDQQASAIPRDRADDRRPVETSTPVTI